MARTTPRVASFSIPCSVDSPSSEHETGPGPGPMHPSPQLAWKYVPEDKTGPEDLRLLGSSE
jgi:hypothetical protein